MTTDTTDELIYLVVINDEEQYSIWREDREVPAGWRAEGKRGGREECLAHIGQVWTDMRPLSVRRSITSHEPAKSPGHG
jgi:MbtH protein